jgi:hypothetical protein
MRVISPSLKARIANVTPNDVDTQRIDWAPYAWKAHWLRERLPRPEVLDELAEHYWSARTIKRRYLYDLAARSDAQALLICVLAWGWGADLRGPGKAHEALTRQTGSMAPTTVAQDIVSQLQTGGVEAGFSASFLSTGGGRIAKVGVSYATKFLHFSGYRGEKRPRPCIYDRNVNRALKNEPTRPETPPPWRYVRSTQYASYCKWCEEVATQETTTPAVVEYALFSEGRSL